MGGPRKEPTALTIEQRDPIALQDRLARQRQHIMQVADAWASPDDWGVQTIAVDSLRDIVTALANGDDWRQLARHAKHVLADCRQARCVKRIPWTIASDEVLARLLQETDISASRATKARELRASVIIAGEMES